MTVSAPYPAGSLSWRPPLSFAVLLLSLFWPAGLTAQVVETQEQRLRIVEVTDGLEHPWGLAFLPDGRMLVSERPGRLRLINDGQLEPQPIAGLPAIVAQGQGGLLDVAVHPAFADNRLVYFAYTADRDKGIGVNVARAELDGRRLRNLEVIFQAQPGTTSGRHFGARLVFTKDAFLYITLGDHGQMERAQQPQDHAGSMIRLHDDGRVPLDNPGRDKQEWQGAIYSIGHRNIQGAALHPRSGELWTHEHGPQGGDEINIIRVGRNYGWPVITYGVNYGTGTKIGFGTRRPGMEQPLYYWDPSIAPSGMAFYTGDQFPAWQGNLFVGALRGQMLVRLQLDGDQVVAEERLLRSSVGRIRDVRQGPDGLLYLLTDQRNGALLRLEPDASR